MFTGRVPTRRPRDVAQSARRMRKQLYAASYQPSESLLR